MYETICLFTYICNVCINPQPPLRHPKQIIIFVNYVFFSDTYNFMFSDIKIYLFCTVCFRIAENFIIMALFHMNILTLSNGNLLL